MKSNVEFAVQDGWLHIKRGSSPSQRVRPDGLEVISLVAIERLSAAIALLEPPRSTGACNNLVMVDQEGAVVWRARLPSGSPNNSYVDAKRSTEGTLIAHTWGGQMVEIAVENGRILRTIFAK